MQRLSFFFTVFCFVTRTWAATWYGCWHQQSNKFHKDCIMAFTSLITQQSGSDNRAWLPPFYVEYWWGNCQARIRGSGSGVAVSSLSLLASFDQLGARCQDGFFYYDNGWVNAELHGRAGWKRDEGSVNHTEITADDEFQVPTGANITWKIEENVIRYDEKPSWVPRSSVPILSKRAPPGTYIASWPVSGKSGLYSLYRDDTVNLGAGLVLHSSGIISNMYGVATSMVNTGLTRPTKEFIRDGVEGITGSTVGVAAMTMVLEAGDPNWAALFNSLGDGGNVVKNAFVAAINDWDNMNINTGIYYFYNPGDWKLVRFVINGIVGTVSSLPSG